MKKGAVWRPFHLLKCNGGQRFFLAALRVVVALLAAGLAAALRVVAFLAAGLEAALRVVAFLAAGLAAAFSVASAAEGRRGFLPLSSMGVTATESNNLSYGAFNLP